MLMGIVVLQMMNLHSLAQVQLFLGLQAFVGHLLDSIVRRFWKLQEKISRFGFVWFGCVGLGF